MATITLKGIPDKLYADIKEQAKSNHRSVNSEILFAVKLYLMQKKERPKPEDIIREAREFRQKVKGSIPIEELERGINEGRP